MTPELKSWAELYKKVCNLEQKILDNNNEMEIMLQQTICYIEASIYAAGGVIDEKGRVKEAK